MGEELGNAFQRMNDLKWFYHDEAMREGAKNPEYFQYAKGVEQGLELAMEIIRKQNEGKR